MPAAFAPTSDRDHSLLMVLPRDVDFESIENTNLYKGLYFILGGTTAFSAKKQFLFARKNWSPA